MTTLLILSALVLASGHLVLSVMNGWRALSAGMAADHVAMHRADARRRPPSPSRPAAPRRPKLRRPVRARADLPFHFGRVLAAV